jgi:hypothetical protein
MEARNLKDTWTDMRNHVRDWWDELTDEDLDTLDSDPNQLVPTLQERYGYTRELAEAELEKRLASYKEVGMQNQNSSGNPTSEPQINRGKTPLESSPSQGNQGDQAHRSNQQRDSSTATRNRENESNNKRR